MRLGALVLCLSLSAAAADTREEREALVHYEEGIKRYNLAQYDLAIESFQAAYLRTKAPELLYNIAQAYRLKGACTPSLQFYRNYLRTAPPGAKRASVETAIHDMGKCAAEEASAPAVKGPDAAPVIVSVPMIVQAPPAPLEVRTTWVLPVFVGGGVALAGVGTGLMLWTKVDADALRAIGCAPSCDTNAVNALRTRQTFGVALIAVGAVAAVTGLVWWFFSKHLEPALTEVSPSGASIRF